MPAKKKQQNIYSSANARLAEFEANQKLGALKAVRAKIDNRTSVIVAVAAVAVVIVSQLLYFGVGPGYEAPVPSASASASAEASNSPLVPPTSIAENRTWTGSIEVNGKPLEISLDGAAAPQATANFIALAKNGFYKDITCHRITNGGFFVLQCGDPNGDGSGGPGYNWGPIENAPTDNNYAKGTIAMARAGGDASSNGSQFFIVYEDTSIPSDSAGGYSVFGKVTAGLENLADVIAAGVEGGGTDGKPALETKLGAITVK
jgi:peptidyl-prolyl cis-trans isomerase B (cyclophilin B)